MSACAPTLVATWTKLAKDVTHLQVLVRLVSVLQWYSSESEPPGPRSNRVPISWSSEMVSGVSKLMSQMAVFTANHRASTARTAWVALRLKCDSAGAGTGTNWISST